MTTSVTDDRQEAFESWYATHYKTVKPSRRSQGAMKNNCPDLHYNKFQENMAYAAWQAAIRSHGKVVLHELAVHKMGAGTLSYIMWSDLNAIIGEGD